MLQKIDKKVAGLKKLEYEFPFWMVYFLRIPTTEHFEHDFNIPAAAAHCQCDQIKIAKCL